MKKMKDYHNLYLKCHVLLLVNFFEKFRNNSLKNYELCPSHYLSAPGLSWDAMLRMTKYKIDLVPDPEMYIFFEKGTRGGISYICNRYNKADHEYLKSYDLKTRIIMDSGFKWIYSIEFDLNRYTSNSLKGCVFEVDLEYPKELRESNSDYHLAPDKIEIKREILSEYQLKITDLYSISAGMLKN